MKQKKPNRKTIKAAIRGSVPAGKLKRARILIADTRGKAPIGGFTEYDAADRKTVTKIGSPDGDSAFDITVRGHETRHATRHVLTRKKPTTAQELEAGQAVDDVNVETLQLPTWLEGEGLREYRRAHMATALADIRQMVTDKRQIKAGLAPDSWETRNKMLMAAIRAKAMLAHYRDGADLRTVTQGVKASRKLADMLGRDVSRALHAVIQLAKSRRTRARAISMLQALMEEEPLNEDDREDKEGRVKDGDVLMPPTLGSAADGRFTINDLRPKSAYTAKEKTISMRYTPDGVHLNASRFVSAIVQGDANGLFSRRVRMKAGGTVVIDASGSMGATAENLTALAQLIPTATIAYYSGDDISSGMLTIYAKNGKRYAGQLPEETLKGGNSVDLQSVQWMMKHGKPWTFISDLEFCGGVLGSEIIAKALLNRAERRGDVTIHRSLDAAFEAFGGKGTLGHAAKRVRR